MTSGNLEEITFMVNRHASRSGGVAILLSLYANETRVKDKPVLASPIHGIGLGLNHLVR